MKRRDFLKTSAIAGLGAFLPYNAFADLKRRNFTELRRNVGIFTERGGTIGWLASENALVAVDSQYPESATNCITGLKDRTSRRPMDFLINTHHHGDHTGGNGVFKEFANHIVAHENVPVLQKQAAENSGNDSPEPITADLTFSENWKQDVGDEIVHANYFGRAHTRGDSVIYFEKANVAHMGDLIFNRAYPYIDAGAGASVRNWSVVLDAVLEMMPSDAMYIFGHANPKFEVTGNADDVKVMRDFLAELVVFTEKGIQSGKSKEELMKTEVLPGFEEFTNPDWFLQLSNNIEVTYNELTAN